MRQREGFDSKLVGVAGLVDGRIPACIGRSHVSGLKLG